MALVSLVGTAWTVWKVTSKRFGPVGGAVATAAVVGGIVYLRPWLAENVPALAGILGAPDDRDSLPPGREA